LPGAVYPQAILFSNHWCTNNETGKRFQVLTTARIKMTDSLLGYSTWRFRGAYCLHLQGDSSQYALLKRRCNSTTLHGTVSQKAVILRVRKNVLFGCTLKFAKAFFTTLTGDYVSKALKRTTNATMVSKVIVTTV
jgi:hypothetical protein